MTEAKLKMLIKKYHVPGNIIRHMNKTAKVCVYIAKKLKANKIKVNINLVRQAGALHDLVKLVDFSKIDLSYYKKKPSKNDIDYWNKLIKKYHKYKHCLAGYKVLLKEKEPEIALIVKKHCYNSLIAKNIKDRPTSWEEKIVYYADKRVKFDKVVSLKARIKDGQKRYFPDGNIPKNDIEVQKALFRLEKDLCLAAKIRPEEIK